MRHGFKAAACVLGLALATATASFGNDVASELRPSLTFAPASTRATPTPAACCKICKKGKACGNSCIARDKNCHQPPGCACDG
jgi:hypothetical protein